jgi:hypothetical protein
MTVDVEAAEAEDNGNVKTTLYVTLIGTASLGTKRKIVLLLGTDTYMTTPMQACEKVVYGPDVMLQAYCCKPVMESGTVAAPSTGIS